MKRCAICDYVPGYGSDAYGIGPDNRRVTWKETHQEYQCEVCAEGIKTTILEKEMEDALKILEETDDDTALEELDLEDCGIPAALSQSKLPF